MRIAQISDFHYTCLTWNPFRLLSKRIFGQMNWLLKRKAAFSEAPVEALPPLLQELQVDWVLLGGDFSSSSMEEEFMKAKNFVSRLAQPWIAVPGNHDHYTYESYRNKEYYRYFTNPGPARHSLSEEGLEIHAIAPSWTVIALDTARPTPPPSSQGLLTEALEERLEKALEQLSPEQNIVLFNHYPFFQNDEPHRNLERGEALEQLIRRHPRIRLYLHGHTHRHTIADLQPNGLPLILDGGCVAQAKKGSWNLIDLDEEGALVTAYSYDGSWKPERREKVVWTRQ